MQSRISSTQSSRVIRALVAALAVVGCLTTALAGSPGAVQVGSAQVGTPTAEAAINCDNAWRAGNYIAYKFADIQYFARSKGICLTAKNGSKLFVSYLYGETTLTMHFTPLCSHVRRSEPIFRGVHDWIKQYPWNSLGRGCRAPGVSY